MFWRARRKSSTAVHALPIQKRGQITHKYSLVFIIATFFLRNNLFYSKPGLSPLVINPNSAVPQTKICNFPEFSFMQLHLHHYFLTDFFSLSRCHINDQQHELTSKPAGCSAWIRNLHLSNMIPRNAKHWLGLFGNALLQAGQQTGAAFPIPYTWTGWTLTSKAPPKFTRRVKNKNRSGKRRHLTFFIIEYGDDFMPGFPLFWDRGQGFKAVVGW